MQRRLFADGPNTAYPIVIDDLIRVPDMLRLCRLLLSMLLLLLQLFMGVRLFRYDDVLCAGTGCAGMCTDCVVPTDACTAEDRRRWVWRNWMGGHLGVWNERVRVREPIKSSPTSTD